MVAATTAPANVKAGMDSIIAKAINQNQAQQISQQGNQLQDYAVGYFDGQYVSVDVLLNPSSGWPSGGTGSQAVENLEMNTSGVAAPYYTASDWVSQQIWGSTFPGSNGYPGGGAFAANLSGNADEVVYGQYLTATIITGAA